MGTTIAGPDNLEWLSFFIGYKMKISIYFKVILSGIAILGLVIFLLFPTFTQASQGCCSYHGGQSYCDTNTGRWVCNDGTYSPTCTCYKAPAYIATPIPTPTPPVCTLNGMNYYSQYDCNLEAHKNGIRQLYISLLGRSASEDEVNLWASNISDIKTIEEQIKQSDEYKQKHPSPTPIVSSTQSPKDNSNNNNIIMWIGLSLIVVSVGILIGYIIGKNRKGVTK